MTHEHLLVDGEWPNNRFTFDLMLDSEDLAIEELAYYAQAGGRTILEVSTTDLARDPAGLKRISEATGVNVVMGCGWYRQPYYPEAIDRSSVNQLSALLISEIRDGVGDTGIRPGIIGEIGSHKGYVSAQEERVFRAAARAAKATGLAVTTHAIPDLRYTQLHGRAVGLQQLEILLSEGLDPSRIVIGHCDTWLYYDYHRAIVAAGAYIQFDGIGATSWLAGLSELPWVENKLIDHIRRLIGEGFLHQIVLSEDVGHKSHLKAYGGAGYDYLLTQFVPRMRVAGIGDDEIRTVLVENPMRMLTGDARE